MRTGIITALPKDKTYGFIKDADNSSSYFFHMTSYEGDWLDLRLGTSVEFDLEAIDGKQRAVGVRKRTRHRKKLSVGAYGGPTLDLDLPARRRALEEIARWKLEAKLEDVQRYFFAVPELNDITTGDAAYVIGRKGTGKTAVVQYLAGRKAGPLVTKLTFKNFPFNELYKHENNNYTRPNQYISLWKLIIYGSVCRMMAGDPRVDPLIRKQVEKAFPSASSDNLSTVIGKWTTGDFGVNVLGNGVSLSNWFKEKRQATIQEKVENLEAFIAKHADMSTYLVLFDELDEDYKEIFERYQKSEYIDLLTSLFKAVQDVRATLGGGVKVFPVVFLRDDIYDLIKDADKNKWRDLQVTLTWTRDGIRSLLAYRLSKVFSIGDSSDFDKLWYSIFAREPVKYSGGNKNILSFDYISMSTQNRPRDYINYLQECAVLELKRTAAEISEGTVKDADKAYSNYLRKELIDEMHGLIPDVDKVLGIFSESRKWITSIDEFRQAYQERVDAGTLKIADADFTLRTLFYFSVIGNLARVGVHIFRHESPEAELNFKERIVVHRGLMKSLQII